MTKALSKSKTIPKRDNIGVMQKKLGELQYKLTELQNNIVLKKEKNYRRIRDLKKEIARAQTRINFKVIELAQNYDKSNPSR